MTDTLEQNPEAIERDIRRTQEDMSRTIDKIGDQLTPRNLFNALLDKADDNNVDARMLLDGARRNPIALGLIAAGTIWLISDKDSTFPSLPARNRKQGDNNAHVDPHHRDYVSYMSGVEMRDGEDPLAYQRRRDAARANYFMLERHHDEDDSSFRQRLDELTDKFREKRQAWSEKSGQARRAAGRGASRTADKAQSVYNDNPLVGGLVAAALGAALGATVPLTRTEDEALGTIGDKARELASEHKDALTDKLREKKDELVDKADEKLQQHSSEQPSAESYRPGEGAPGYPI
jgi:hypothetical protein